MINDIVGAVDAIHNIYISISSLISRLNPSSSLKKLDKVILDIMAVKTEGSKAALCAMLSKNLQSIAVDIEKLESLVQDLDNIFAKIKNTMPMSKNDVQSILKIFNFHNCSVDETTEENLALCGYAKNDVDVKESNY